MQASPFARRLTRAASTPRRFTLLLTLLALAALVPFATHGAGGGRNDDPAPRQSSGKASKSVEPAAAFVPGQLLVRFRSEASARRAEASPGVGRARVLDGVSSEIGARVERFEGSDLVRGLRIVYVDPAETLAAVEAFKSMPQVLYAEPDYIRHITATPNDPRFPESGMYGLRKINAPVAWDTTTGSPNVVVGVIDEGVDITHPDLAANIWTNPGEIAGNGVDDDGNGKVDDVNGWDFSTCTGTNPATNPACGNNTVWDGAGGALYPTDETDSHGTHVSGTIGAVGNNGVGVVGVNWNVRIMPLKFIGATGASSNAIRAEAYAKAMRDKFLATGGAQGANVRVLNNSYGGGGSSQAELDSIRAVGASGILFVVAAGNDSTNNDFIPTFPSNYDAPNLIAVASSTTTDSFSSFSNIGARLVSVAAPGSGILSTTPDNTYSQFSGTSMATPHVAGLAALICSLDPQIDVQRLRSLVAYNGDVIAFGLDRLYTQRRINAAKSIAAFLEHDTTPPAAPRLLRTTIVSGRNVRFTFNAPGDDDNTGTPSLYEISFVTNGGTVYVLKTIVPDAPAGSSVDNGVNLPFHNSSGTLRVKAIDNAGNESVASIPVSVDPASVEPFTTSESASTGLAALGTPLNFHTDDNYTTVSLPSGFSFPYLDVSPTSVVVSSNGALYFQPLSTLPPANNVDEFGDSGSSTQQLEGFKMVAGLWDDLRTDCSSNTFAACDVYVNTSDPNKVVFRWEARVFNATPDAGSPVEFEIELNRDGTIRTRYGAGNTGVKPVVGIGAGEQGGSYVIASHTSKITAISLTNAATVTFAPRTAAPPPPPAAIFQFTSPAFGVFETQGAAAVVVSRSGDTSAAVSVDVRTVDNPAAVPCADTSGTIAFARCDYATTVQTVTFAAGDSQPKIVNIPLIDDAHVEPVETFQVELSSPTSGATIGTVSTVTLSIVSDDAAGAQNPVTSHDYSFFVRQQYLDFFGREPEAAGFSSWKGTLDNCPDPFNTNAASPSANCDRISVSRNFFLSKEFALKGFFVYNFYKVAFGRLPHYSEIIPDMASLTAVDDAGFHARKAAFTSAFTQRQEFKNLYDALSHTQFVDALMNPYSLQLITTPDPLNPDGSTKITLTRADMVGRLNLGTLTRAQALRALADSDEVGRAEFNSAFVAMQYFGYLRRDPEEGGYNDWLRTINANPADSRSMVNGFMNSAEYRLRFGQQ